MKRDSSRGLELYSREVFQILLDYEVNRSQRYPSPLTLLNMVVIPGEQTSAIQEVMDAMIASILNTHLRSADIPAKMSNQYLVLLPTTDESGGRAVSERLLSLFKGLLQAESGVTFSVSAFIGISSHPGGLNLAEDILLQQASAALQHARQQRIATYTAYSDIDRDSNP
jgi:hypothetical protein